MKRLVLTAVLLLFRLLLSPQVQVLPLAATLAPHIISHKDKSDLRIREMTLHAGIDPKDDYKQGTLDVQVIFNDRPPAGAKATIEVRAATLIRKLLPVMDTALSFTLSIPNVKRWSAETPAQYQVRVRLTDSSGHALDSASGQVSFRDVTLRNGHYYVNGRPVWIKGMLQHKFDSAEIRLMKQYNINAVREADTNRVRWHELCDRYGLYVIDTPVLVRTFAPCGPMPDNSLGGLRDYWDSIQTHPDDHAGAFVYELFTPGEKNVLPAAWEVKKVYQPVHTSQTTGTKGVPGITLRVFNDYDFRDLSHLSMEWQVLVNGIAGQHGTAALPLIPPQKTGRIQLPIRMPATGEVLLNIIYRLKKAEPLLPAGHVVAAEQLALRETYINDVSIHPAGELIFKDEGGTFAISSPATGLDLQFNKQTGWLQHYVIGGHSLLEDTLGLTANFWRPPTDCDDAGRLPSSLSAWKHATHESRLQLFSTSTSNDFVIVRADYLLPETACLLHIHYTINAKGEMQVEEILEQDSTQTGSMDTSTVIRKTMLPRMGMKWILPAGYDSIIYYGRGPQENYTDRNYGAALGIYRQTVEEQFYPYRRPQENGTRTDIHWWKITDPQGHGMQITADSALLSTSALHYYDSDLEEGKLVPRPQTQLNIDLRQMGLEGKGLPYGNYHYIYKVIPL